MEEQKEKPLTVAAASGRPDRAERKTFMKHYSTKEKMMLVAVSILMIIALVLVTLMVMEICGVFDEPVWKPATEHPLTNAHIGWMQTFRGGAWQ